VSALSWGLAVIVWPASPSIVPRRADPSPGSVPHRGWLARSLDPVREPPRGRSTVPVALKSRSRMSNQERCIAHSVRVISGQPR